MGKLLPVNVRSCTFEVNKKRSSWTYVIYKYVNHAYSNDDFSSCFRPRVRLIYDCDDKLTEATDYKTPRQKDSSPAVTNHDAEIDKDGEDAHCHEDTRVHEWVSNISHFKEIRSIRFIFLLAVV
jgi:hypothetical protein